MDCFIFGGWNALSPIWYSGLATYHFLDESGGPGLGGTEGSSSHFVLAMVQLDERASISELAVIRKTLHLSSTFEFKYRNMTSIQKAVFFESMRKFPFRVRAVVIDKSVPEKWFIGLSGRSFIVTTISRLVLRAPVSDIVGHVLIIDGATPALRRALRIRLSMECRELNRPRPFKKIIGADSAQEDGLQLADMIAGALRQHAMKIESRWYETLVNKIVDLWEIPARE